MTLYQVVIRIFNWVLKNAIGFVVGGAIVAFFMPRDRVIIPGETVYRTDTTGVKLLNREIQKERDAKIPLLKRIFSLEKQLEATAITTGNTVAPVLAPTVITKTDTTTRETARWWTYKSDLAYYVEYDDGILTVLTLNTFLESQKGDYVKKYLYHIPYENFSFTVLDGIDSIDRSGLRVRSSRPFAKWGGVWGGVSGNLPRGSYVWLDARAGVYSIDLRGRLTSEPAFELEVGFRLY